MPPENNENRERRNNTLNWVSISSAGALHITHCDFSVRSARDDMRHITGGSGPDHITGSDKDQNRGCKRRDTDHITLLCQLYEVQSGVQSLLRAMSRQSEVHLRKRCVTRIMPGTRTKVADLCIFLAAYDERGPGFVNMSVRTVTNARQFGMQVQKKCTGTHRHARVGASNSSEKKQQPETWHIKLPEQWMEEQLREDKQELKVLEQKKKSKGCKEDTRDCS